MTSSLRSVRCTATTFVSSPSTAALAERHGGGWRAWPPSYHSPRTGRVARFAREHESPVRLHMWLQWQLDVQLAWAAASGCQLVGDLAVGFDPGGADAWMWQDLLALDAHVGAPPDGFNVEGQDWGLPPFIPWKLRAAHFDPFIKTVRAAMRGVSGLRVDHVMGLYRLFWIPPGGSAKTGAYVHLPSSEMLDLLALESTRAGAFVVGEDLGTVEDEVREDLADRGILSYRLVWFEETEPERYPVQALAAVTTHDLPTLAGAWTGSDLEDQRRIGMTVSESGADWFKSQLEKVTGFGPDADLSRVVIAAHRALAGRALGRGGGNARRRSDGAGAAQHAGHGGRVARTGHSRCQARSTRSNTTRSCSASRRPSTKLAARPRVRRAATARVGPC